MSTKMSARTCSFFHKLIIVYYTTHIQLVHDRDCYDILEFSQIINNQRAN